MTPEPRRLVLLRHGRTAWNLEGRAQGHADVPLDEVGHAQAREVAPYVAALRPTTLWSSDLARAAQTASYVGDACGLPVRHDPRLREFSVGEREGLLWDEAVQRFPHLADAGPSLGERLRGVPGAESDADVAGRVVPALEGLLDQLSAGETAVAVTHGAAVKIALAGLLGLDLEAARAFAVLGNCRWALVEQVAIGDRRRLAVYGGGDFASTGAIG